MRNILIGLATFFVLESGAQCMSGVYTIGGVSPNYSTINAAVSALVSNGICGPVSLNIRNGVYNERISLPAISGSSPINTITFQSESGDSSLVTISETSVSGNNYVVRLNGSDNVIFRKLSIVNGASGTTSYQSTFVMNNDADNITVESCVMSCLPNANSNIVNNSFALIFAGYTLGTIGDSITIRNNRLIGNNYGVSLYYSTPTYPENLVIHNNLIVDQYNYGIRTGFYGKISITRNEIIQTAPSPLLYYAFLGGTTDTIFVSNNKIRGYGSGLSILGLSSTCYAKVWNNDIVVQGLGITVSYLTCQVYHNTVRTESPTGNALTALWIGQGILQCDVRNNIFLNRGPGVSYGLIHLDHVSPAVYSGDGNVFDCGTYKLFSFIYPTILQHYQYLYQWSAVTGGDLSSASSNAQFVSSSNSHILNDFSQNASAGIVGGIITDADGAPRSLIRPYPGAYESVRLVGNDASAIIVRSNPTECTGNLLLNVLVQNRGLTPLTSVQVNWTLNNVVQIPYLWTGSINSMDTVAISAISFPAAIGNTYAIKAWTSQPNSSSDVYMMNDTTPDDTIRISYTGNYTVGGIAPDFATITQAITALRSNGICNAVTLSLRNGTYNEQVLIDSSLGSSALNTLRITSETGDSTQVIWQYNSTNLNYQYVGRLSGASYVTVDHITVQQLSAVYPTVVQIDGGAHDINFSSCILTSPASIQNPPGGAIVSSPSTEENFLKFRNTIFNGGSTGIYLLAPNTGENGLEIANCWFNNQSQTGIYALAIGQLVLTDNVISSNAPNMQVGINVGMKDTCVISNNIVDGSFEKGMQLSNLNLLPNPVLTIFNNSINGRFRSTTQYGIFVWQIDKFKMNFNTVRLATPNSHAVYLWATDSASVQNNVFSVFASNGRAFSMYSTWSSGFVENYNDLYVSSGLQLYKDPVLYTSMSAWRNATGFSMNSMEVDPNFLIPNDCHIHESDLRNTGTSIVGISEDFEHEPRSNPPDIGADEQTSSYVDIECKRIVLPVALCAGVVNVPMVLKNQGTVLINQATINWSVNGVPQPVVNWSGALASGDSIIVSLGNYNFLTNGPPYNVECIVSNPNLLPDPFAFNDTAFYSVGGSALSGTYTIGGASPDFANVVQATTALNARGVCGPVTMKIRNGTYSGAIQLNSIAGASSVNRIRFESQSGDSSQVIITAVGSSTANYSVGLTGASFITFSKVTFSNSNATYGSVMRITGTCKSDSIYHCVFTTSPSATNADLIYEGGAGSKTNFDIIGNRFINGRNAVNWFYNSPDSNFVFSRNKVQCNQANGEVRLSYIYGLKVEDNDIILGSVRTEYIYSSLLVRKNRINGMLGVEYCNNSTSVLIVNNVVTNSGGVLFVQNSDGLRIINNTFRCTGNTTCVTLGSSINITYFNNLVTTTSATGTLFSANYALTFDTCNYNGWYMVNGIFCSFNSVNYASFTAWQTTSGYDANSVFQDPLFLSPTDFHLQNSSPMLQHALPVSEAPDDIDGDLRGPTPDLGGDENPVYTVEIAVTGSNISSCLSASTPITIDVLNNGSLPLTSCTINWSVNQIVQTPVNWSGSISPYQTMSGIPVSTYPFVLGHSYQVIIWISSPNNSIDPLPYNDSVSGLALPRYSGLYTVGGNSPDFVNPQAAVDSLSTNGVCGPVTLRIRSGTYNGIEIEAIPGSSIQNSVTLTSETGDSSDVVFLTIPDSLTSYNGATFLLDSTSNIIFDRLTFSSGLSVVPILIQFVNNNENITITHCRFNGIHGTIAPTVHNGLIDTRSGFYSKVKISNNTFVDGARGIYLEVANGLVIENNKFLYQEKGGMIVGAGDSLRVRANYLTDAGNYTDYVGILCGFSSPSATDSCIIEKNVIDVNLGIAGIEFSGGTNGPFVTSLIRNNAISIGASTGGNGLEVSGTYVGVIYNTVRVQGSACNAAFKTALSNSLIYNNCVVNYCSSGFAFDFFGNSNNLLNNNNYFSSSGVIGSVSGNNYSTLQSYQAATNSESNSVEGNPLLFNTPFWKTGSSLLQNAGVSMNSYASRDIEGQLRMGVPDIGADEFAPYQDAGLYKINSPALTCSGSHSLQVGIRNYGSSTATAFNIIWSVNGVQQPTFYWSGSLASGDSLTAITVGSFVSTAGSAEVVANIQFPGDVNHLNDTVRNDRTAGPLSGDYSVGGFDPDYRMLDDAFTAIETNGVCGPVRLLLRDGFYFEHATLSNVMLNSGNGLTIESESLDSSAVTIFQFMADPLLVNSLVQLDTVSNITIRGLGFNNGTLQNAPSSNAIYSVCGNKCTDVRVTQSKFESLSNSSASIRFLNANRLVIDSNDLSLANNAVLIGAHTPGGDSVRSVLFYNNHLTGLFNVSHSTDVNIHDNEFQSFELFDTGDSISVYRNFVSQRAFLSDLHGTPSSKVVIWNNFFYNGITASYLNHTDVIFNNIGMYQADVNVNYAFILNQADYCNVLNNNITCTYFPVNGVAFFAPPFYITNCSIDYNNYWNGSQSALISSQQVNGHDNYSISIDPQFVGILDLHVQNAQLAGTGLQIVGIQDDIDNDLRPTINPGIGADDAGAVAVNSSLVWPGNANKDTIVNSYDLLPIGLYMGQIGYTRSNASNAWVGQSSFDWPINQNNGYNLKFVDSDGDGVIGISDTTAVGLNYGQLDFSPPIPPSISSHNSQTSGTLFFETTSSVYQAGSAIDVYLWVGDTVQPVYGLYGAAFTIGYSSIGVSADSTRMTIMNSWLGNPNIDALSINRCLQAQSYVEGAVVRFDHTPRNGFGPVAILHLVSDSSITQPTIVHFNVLNYELIDSIGNQLQFFVETDSVTILPLITSIENVKPDTLFNAYPNPADRSIEISFTAYAGQNIIVIADLLGREVYRTSFQEYSCGRRFKEINTADLPNGTYFLSHSSENGCQTIKLSVRH